MKEDKDNISAPIESSKEEETKEETTDTDIFIKLTKMETEMMKKGLSIAAILPTRKEKGD